MKHPAICPTEYALLLACSQIRREEEALCALTDYYLERGDEDSAEGVRWASVNCKRPQDYYGSGWCWAWYWDCGNDRCNLSWDLFSLIPHKGPTCDTEHGRFFGPQNMGSPTFSNHGSHPGAGQDVILHACWHALFDALADRRKELAVSPA